MSKKTVLDCPDEATPADSDFLYLIKGLSDRKIKLSVLKNFFLTPVTKAFVGLGNVPDWSGDTNTALGTSDVKIPSQKAVKVYVDNAKNALWPVGSTYIQFPGDSSPSTLGLPGTWTNVSSELPGDFIRFEGSEASAFGSGRQDYAARRVTGSFQVRNTESGGKTVSSASGVFSSADNGSSVSEIDLNATDRTQRVIYFDNDDVINTSSTGLWPNNITVRKWRRTS